MHRKWAGTLYIYQYIYSYTLSHISYIDEHIPVYFLRAILTWVLVDLNVKTDRSLILVHTQYWMIVYLFLTPTLANSRSCLIRLFTLVSNSYDL